MVAQAPGGVMPPQPINGGPIKPPGFGQGMGQFGQLPQQASGGFGDRRMPYIGQMMLQQGFGTLAQPNYGVRAYAPGAGLGLEYGNPVPSMQAAAPRAGGAGGWNGATVWANG